MIKRISIYTYQNGKENRFDIPLRDPYECGFAIAGIEGLTPPKADIGVSDYSMLDGGVFTTARVGSRNIVLTLAMFDDRSIEERRQFLYSIFPIKEKIRFGIETDRRNLYIDGYVESVAADIFAPQCAAQISIICPNPYFIGEHKSITLVNTGEVGYYISDLYLTNPGEITTGITFEVKMLDDYPTGDPNIPMIIAAKDTIPYEGICIDLKKAIDATGQSFALLENDIIRIESSVNKKNVVLVRDDVEYSIINTVVPSLELSFLSEDLKKITTTWPMLKPGIHNVIFTFGYLHDFDPTFARLTAEYDVLYEGI